jgi:three-Cys-motif partner protein
MDEPGMSIRAADSHEIQSDAPLIVADDGFYTPEIKRHSVEKIRLHNRYAGIFASSMRQQWPQLAYVGLYSGPGRARVAGTGHIIETSALSVLRQPNGFTNYVYVDHDPVCVEALTRRADLIRRERHVQIIQGDVNQSMGDVRSALPPYGRAKGLLSFCFVDPFDLQLRFSTIRALAHLRMDFLVLLMLGVDGRRNFARYLADPTSTRIGDFIDCPDWRSQYTIGRSVIHFLLEKFDDAMQREGYLSAADDAHCVRVFGMGVLQYVLAFYSKNALGKHFWRETRASLSPQLGFEL